MYLHQPDHFRCVGGVGSRSMFDHLPYDLFSLGLNEYLSLASTECASLDMTLAAMTINIATEA